MRKQKQCIPVVIVWILLTMFAWFGPANAESEAERRPLKQFPGVSVNAVFNGSFMGSFEDYTLDQFPLRDSFRRIKALFHTGALRQKDTNGIYVADGFAAKMEYVLSETSLAHALSRFQYAKDTCFPDSRVFMAVVPDKGYYLAEKTGRLSLDYDRLYSLIQEGMPWAEQIDLRDTLKLTDYYRTDTHWRQEHLIPAASAICSALDVTVPVAGEYTQEVVSRPFYGVYYGQAALPMDPEPMYLLKNSMLEECTVYDHETGKTGTVYDLSKLNSRDLYDVYLSGARALLTIDNPRGIPGKELIIFRDSFGSSIIPRLIQDYARVTVVDIRYVGVDLLRNFVEFKGQDVLMLYSTLILNSSSALK